MNSIKNMPVLALFMLIAGCASLFSGIEQEMTFKSDPEGATVYVDGLEKGKTPLVVKLRKDEYKNVTFKKIGYRDEVVTLHSKLDPIGLLNLIVITGFTTDALTGAMFEYAPGQYLVKLEKEHRKVSATHMDRDYESELKNFVLDNYSTLKSQCQTSCENALFHTLSWLVAKVYKKDNKIAKHYALAAFTTSGDSVEYLRLLESRVKTNTLRVAVIKGNQ